jgi:hypothetical protein
LSFFTGTQNACEYSYAGAATTTTPTAGAVSIIATYPPVIIPGGILGKLGNQSSALRVRAWLQCTATATVPTWLLGVSKTTTNTFSSTGGIATATFTPSVKTAAQIMMEIEISLRSIGQTNNSTAVVQGQVEGPDFLPSPFSSTIPATNVANTWTDWQVDQQYYLWLYLTLGAATAGNTVTTQMLKVYGEN